MGETPGIVFDALVLFGVNEQDELRACIDRDDMLTQTKFGGAVATVTHLTKLHKSIIVKLAIIFESEGVFMIITNIEYIPGKEITEHFGVVSGSTVRAKHVGRDIAASLKNIFGGELKGYTELLSESRDEAIERMKAQARSLGANAILNVRFSTSSVAAGAAELYVYGTAVRVV